jgi:hypothetical protein
MLTRLVIHKKEPFANGQQFPITGAYEKLVGKVRAEIVVDEKGVKSQSLSADERVKRSEAASRDKAQASLTVREKSYGKRISVPPSSEWEFAASTKDSRTGIRSGKSKLQRSLSPSRLPSPTNGALLP